jgi:hypothetical protein
MPQDEWDAVLDEVAAGMAAAGGRNLRTQQV